MTSFADVASSPPPARLTSGVDALDRVLTGGFVQGATVLLVSPTSAGATTLALQVGEHVARGADGRRVLLGEAELNKGDLRLLSRRLGLSSEGFLVSGSDGSVFELTNEALAERPALIILDSIQQASVDDIDDDVGTEEQLLAITNWLSSFGKAEEIAVVILAHATPEVERIKHVVDAVIRLEPFTAHLDSDSVQPTDRAARVLSSEKNRHGPAGIVDGIALGPSGFTDLSPALRQRVVDCARPAGK